jgi:hypothetical protein
VRYIAEIGANHKKWWVRIDPFEGGWIPFIEDLRAKQIVEEDDR